MRTYLRGIRFRGLDPQRPHPAWSPGLEVEATVLPEDADRTRITLAPLEELPRMSTFAIAAAIARAMAELEPGQAYLNVGLWHGYTLLAGMLARPESVCIGVDDFSGFGAPREAFLDAFARHRRPAHRFYEMDFERYLTKVHREPIGLYFYDGPHGFEDQARALVLAEPFLAPGCIVMIDDTNWEAPRRATQEFMEARAGTYELLLDVRTCQNGHPTWWNGMMVWRKREGQEDFDPEWPGNGGKPDAGQGPGRRAVRA